MLNQAEFVENNFNPNNPFHRAVKQYGYSTYAQVILIATADHQNAIAKCEPISNIALRIRNRALELLDDETFMNGLRLENDLGL